MPLRLSGVCSYAGSALFSLKQKTPLQRPYEGPYRIISTSEKFFTLDVNGQAENISVDRHKTAYPATRRYPPQLNNQEEDISTPSSSPPLPNKSPSVTTIRSGRSVQRPPHIVNDYIAAIQQWYGNAGGEPCGYQSALKRLM